MAPFSRDPGLTWYGDGSAGELDLAATLVGSLVEPADQLRDLEAFFGVSPWRTFLVLLRWSGDRRGLGTAEVFSEVELLPSPSVVERKSRATREGGTVEEGDLELAGISLVYTEDQLLGRGTGGAPIDRNVEAYWELRPRDAGERVRATVVRLERDWSEVQWRATLAVARPRRGREGGLP